MADDEFPILSMDINNSWTDVSTITTSSVGISSDRIKKSTLHRRDPLAFIPEIDTTTGEPMVTNDSSEMNDVHHQSDNPKPAHVKPGSNRHSLDPNPAWDDSSADEQRSGMYETIHQLVCHLIRCGLAFIVLQIVVAVILCFYWINVRNIDMSSIRNKIVLWLKKIRLALVSKQSSGYTALPISGTVLGEIAPEWDPEGEFFEMEKTPAFLAHTDQDKESGLAAATGSFAPERPSSRDRILWTRRVTNIIGALSLLFFGWDAIHKYRHRSGTDDQTSSGRSSNVNWTAPETEDYHGTGSFDEKEPVRPKHCIFGSLAVSFEALFLLILLLEGVWAGDNKPNADAASSVINQDLGSGLGGCQWTENAGEWRRFTRIARKAYAAGKKAMGRVLSR